MRYHGLDLHKGSAAVSIRDEAGHETRYVAKVETASYVATLGSQDSVALESGCGSFLWAERIERQARGASSSIRIGFASSVTPGTRRIAMTRGHCRWHCGRRLRVGSWCCPRSCSRPPR